MPREIVTNEPTDASENATNEPTVAGVVQADTVIERAAGGNVEPWSGSGSGRRNQPEGPWRFRTTARAVRGWAHGDQAEAGGAHAAIE